MCLTRVKEIKKVWKKGYKFATFDPYNRSYMAPYRGMNYGRIGDCCKCTGNYTIIASDSSLYESGIHILKTLKGAREYGKDIYGDCCLLEVEYTDVVASGYDDKVAVDVAKTMRIVKTLGRKSRIKWDELLCGDGEK